MKSFVVALSTVAICSMAAAAEPVTATQLKLLKQFRGEFIRITPGKSPYPSEFMMGGEGPQESPRHRVTFDYDFSIAKYEVTQNLWQAVTGKNPSRWKGPRNSVELLSWGDAVRFCESITRLMREAKLIAADEEIRLPSEAEWEYSARAGTTTKWSFGDERMKLDAHAWSTHNAAGNDPPVGAKKPNAWGLYDVHGYLWEWVADTGQKNFGNAPTDGSAWIVLDNEERGVLRGGSWKDKADKLTSSFRMIAARETRDDAVGLRCVLAKAKVLLSTE